MIIENQHKNLKYIISYPEGFSESRKYPLIVFLHGAGTRGKDIEALKTHCCIGHLTDRQTKGYILAAPLCPEHDWNSVMEALKSFVAELLTFPYVDRDRVYLTGLSMGGYGTWELGMIHPEWFAAIMPLCGGGCAGFGARLKNVPTRAFHGLLDKRVDPIESLEMAKAVNRFGGYCELILFPDLAHNCWDRVYTTEENYDWLLSHSLKSSEDDGERLGGANYG